MGVGGRGGGGGGGEGGGGGGGEFGLDYGFDVVDADEDVFGFEVWVGGWSQRKIYVVRKERRKMGVLFVKV